MAGALTALATSSGGGVSFSAIASPSSFTKVGNAPGSIQTALCTCSVINGTPPYSYQWTYVSGDTEIVAGTNLSPTTRFFAYLSTSDMYSAVFKCVVTDDTSTVVDSNNVIVTITGV